MCFSSRIFRLFYKKYLCEGFLFFFKMDVRGYDNYRQKMGDDENIDEYISILIGENRTIVIKKKKRHPFIENLKFSICAQRRDERVNKLLW